MALTTAEIARHLKVPEKTVLHWIRKEGLPASQLDHEYRVNRAELLEWATERSIKVPPGLFPGSGEDEGEGEEREIPLPSLSRALETGGIHDGVEGDDKLSALTNVVALLPLPPRVDRDFLLQVLLARETVGTTAVGDGIAIPHVRNPILLAGVEPSVTLCRLANPVDFGAVDGKPVRILFTLTSPTVKSHLHLLSRLAFALRDPSFRKALEESRDAGTILEALRKLEATITRARKEGPPG
jgi:PTS system nitrogen regulatory IIA component